MTNMLCGIVFLALVFTQITTANMSTSGLWYARLCLELDSGDIRIAARARQGMTMSHMKFIRYINEHLFYSGSIELTTSFILIQ